MRNAPNRAKLRAISLVVIMVLATVVAGVGLGATIQRGGTGGQFDPGVGGPNTVAVDESKPVVFQGEDDIQFVGPNNESLDPSQLVGVSGDAEGQPLELPIPEDQTPGQYAFNGQANQPGVTVQTPRVTDLNLINQRGVEVEGSSVQEDETLLVSSEWNFQQGEDLELIVRDENGNEITGDVLTNASALSSAQRNQLTGPWAQNPQQVGNPGQRGTGTGIAYLQGIGQFSDQELGNTSQLDAAYWALDLSDLDAGDYTVTVQGWDNLDDGAATQTTTFGVQTETDVGLDLDVDNATRGERVGYTIRGSTAGAEHYVVIEDDDFRNNRVNVGAFRDIQDVVDRGTYDGNNDSQPDFAWAQVEINDDTGLGAGQIDTTYLDDANIDVNLYGENQSLEEISGSLGDTEDDASLSISQGGLSLDSPAGTYVAGSDTDVSGTAAAGIDDVVLYARDQGDWELVDVNEDGNLSSADAISVDSTGQWEEENVLLSQASDILSIPGRYRFGVVEAQDATGANGQLRTTLTPSEFSSATSTQSSIIVQDPSLEEERVYRAINGQIAVEDGTVDVTGVAPGLQDVLVVMVDSRGRIVTDQVAVDDNDTFEEDDISLVTAEGQSLNEGEIEAMVIGLGRDGNAGDGILPGQRNAEIGSLEEYIQNIGTGLTQQQVTERILDETSDEVASDDLTLMESFRYTDGSTTIEAVGPAGENVSDVEEVEVGETLVVSGLTNRKPDDNTISVEAIEGPSVDQFDINSTDEWGLTGRWSVSFDTNNVEPGTYTLEADDGDNTDTVQVEVVEPVDGNATETPAGNATATPSGNATATPTETATPSDDETATPEPTETATPQGNETS